MALFTPLSTSWVSGTLSTLPGLCLLVAHGLMGRQKGTQCRARCDRRQHEVPCKHWVLYLTQAGAGAGALGRVALGRQCPRGNLQEEHMVPNQSPVRERRRLSRADGLTEAGVGRMVLEGLPQQPVPWRRRAEANLPLTFLFSSVTGPDEAQVCSVPGVQRMPGEGRKERSGAVQPAGAVAITVPGSCKVPMALLWKMLSAHLTWLHLNGTFSINVTKSLGLARARLVACVCVILGCQSQTVCSEIHSYEGFV